MKTKLLFSFLTVFSMICLSGTSQTSKQGATVSSASKVEAYYFHFTNRCTTCKAVEAEAKKDLEMLFGNKVNFRSINLDDDTSKAIAEKLKISGQTLLIVKGDAKINLTNEGFLYAVNNPEKFKSIIKGKVEALLKL